MTPETGDNDLERMFLSEISHLEDSVHPDTALHDITSSIVGVCSAVVLAWGAGAGLRVL